MKIAIPAWNGMISPVLDTAGIIRLYTIEGNEIAECRDIPLPPDSSGKAALIGGSADVLICGAVSAPMETELTACGVTVHSFIMGGVDQTAGDFIRGGPDTLEHIMPGCQRRRRRGPCGRGQVRGQGKGKGMRQP